MSNVNVKRVKSAKSNLKIDWLVFKELLKLPKVDVLSASQLLLWLEMKTAL